MAARDQAPVPGGPARPARRHSGFQDQPVRRCRVTAGGGFPRWWNEQVADLGDHVPGGTAGLAALLLLLAAVASFALTYRRRPARPRGPAEPDLPDLDESAGPADEDTEVPEVPPEELRSLADRYAAEGRYAEAVRERLRAMVRELVVREVIEHRPGWTVTELAAAAGRALPAVAAPLAEAGTVFSDIWYGRQPARVDHDERMRDLEAAVRAVTLSGAQR